MTIYCRWPLLATAAIAMLMIKPIHFEQEAQTGGNTKQLGCFLGISSAFPIVDGLMTPLHWHQGRKTNLGGIKYC